VEDGWIKWHRKSIANPLFKDIKGWHMFEYCCLKANHEPQKLIFNKQEITIKRGQFIWGRAQASIETGINPSSARDKLYLLEKLGYLTRKPANKFTIITICNYDKYQHTKSSHRQQNDNKMTTNRQQNDTNKNVKNDKNIKKEYMSQAKKILEGYPRIISEDRTLRNIVTTLKRGINPEDLIQARNNYSAEVKENDVETRFIFKSTNFFGQHAEWRNYINPEIGEDAKALRDFKEFQKEIRGKKETG